MKRIFILLFLSITFLNSKAQFYKLRYDSVGIVSPLLLGGITTGNSTDSVLVKRPNGRVFKISRSAFAPNYTASNGINISGNDFRLGGTITNPGTLFTVPINNTFSIRGDNTSSSNFIGYFRVDTRATSSGASGVEIGSSYMDDPNQISGFQFGYPVTRFVDTRNNQGLVYGGAYEANFIPESLVSKRYVDGRTSAIIELPTSQTAYTASANQIIITHSTTLTTITLPSTTIIGSLIQVIGEGGGTGNWRIAQQAGQRIVGVGISTTTGTGGTLTATDPNCTVTLRLSAPNKWTITSSQGTLTPL